jgi:hypothetical protein
MRTHALFQPNSTTVDFMDTAAVTETDRHTLYHLNAKASSTFHRLD